MNIIHGPFCMNKLRKKFHMFGTLAGQFLGKFPSNFPIFADETNYFAKLLRKNMLVQFLLS